MNKRLIAGFIVAVVVSFLALIFWTPLTRTLAQLQAVFVEKEPDIPRLLGISKSKIRKEDFTRMRAEQFGKMRGLDGDSVPDPKIRVEAVEKLTEQARNVEEMAPSNLRSNLLASWTPIGPAPISVFGTQYSGRTISIAVHPTNPNIAYVGTAQGGLYRTTDGGTNWTPIMDSAQSIAIGAIAIAPTNHETVYVGTGEHNFSSDSFFGVGVYRIDNASTTATLTGPLNKDAGNNDIFTGRGISRIIVDPSDADNIFVSSTSGVGGIIAANNSTLPSRGIYRSTNATAANPTFTKLTGLAGNINASVRDIAIDPNDPNILVTSSIIGGGGGGIYRSTNALSATPTFTQVEIFNSNSTSELTAEFAAIHPAGDTNATFYAATGNLGGRVLISTDGGATWTQQIDNNFCTPQCFYDIAIAIDPTNVNNLYLGGSPQMVAGVSTNGGTSFADTGNTSGVHVDTHALAVAPSNPAVLYLGTDGGIYKSTNSGASWQQLNNGQFFATQFMSIATHPTDPDFTIGGTQDNGTLSYNATGGTIWSRDIGGDGGYAQIDQNAPDTINVRQYHTFFNSGTQQGYVTRASISSGFSTRGCFGGVPANGINCNDTAVRFYAPLERGPGNPNTIYYGTDRVYRSDDTGLNHTVVSQAPIAAGVPISAMGIAPQDDNVRIVGLSDGQLWGTSTGSAALANLDTGFVIPDVAIGRAVVDPNTVTTAYITLSAFGVNNVYKTTNLNASPPTWTAANGAGGTAIPQVPVSSFVVDPLDSNKLYAGTDIGVYMSADAGTTWAPFGTGLPRVAVFGMSIANGSPRKLRIATHGRGMFEIPLTVTPPGSTRFDFDGDSRTDISIFRPAPGEWWYLRSSDSGNSAFQFGSSTDTITPADFTGDGKTDIAFFRPSSGEWFVLRSEDSTFFAFPFGTNGDIPVPGDYDGDGLADSAVFRPSSATWFINNSGGGTTIQQFGLTGDQPVVADYDGDGKDDIAIFRPSVAEWYLQRSSDGFIGFQFGPVGDTTPVPADYTGDGKADIGFFKPSTSEWFILRSEDSSFFAFPFGTNGDIPVPGDYDGDGTADSAVFRPSNNTWFLNQSTSGSAAVQFGIANDIPVPSAYIP